MHEHESGSLWHEYLSIQFDLAHMLAELGFTLVFDLIIIFLLWGKVLKPWLARSVHKEFDKDHGINHDRPRPPYATGALVDPKDIPPARREFLESEALRDVVRQPPPYRNNAFDFYEP